MTNAQILEIYNEVRGSKNQFSELQEGIERLMKSADIQFKYKDVVFSTCYSLYTSRLVLVSSNSIKQFDKMNALPEFEQQLEKSIARKKCLLEKKNSANVSNENKDSSNVSNENKGSSNVSNRNKDSSDISNENKDCSTVSNKNKESSKASNEDKDSSMVSNENKGPSTLSETIDNDNFAENKKIIDTYKAAVENFDVRIGEVKKKIMMIKGQAGNARLVNLNEVLKTLEQEKKKSGSCTFGHLKTCFLRI